eukprot:8790313-Karenia_brevis.AAC.1
MGEISSLGEVVGMATKLQQIQNGDGQGQNAGQHNGSGSAASDGANVNDGKNQAQNNGAGSSNGVNDAKTDESMATLDSVAGKMLPAN